MAADASRKARAAALSIAGSKAQLNAVLAGRVEHERKHLEAMVLRADRSEGFREPAQALCGKASTGLQRTIESLLRAPGDEQTGSDARY